MLIGFMDGVEMASAHCHGFLSRVSLIGGALSTPVRALCQEASLNELHLRGPHTTVQRTVTSKCRLQGCRHTCETCHQHTTGFKISSLLVLHIPPYRTKLCFEQGNCAHGSSRWDMVVLLRFAPALPFTRYWAVHFAGFALE